VIALLLALACTREAPDSGETSVPPAGDTGRDAGDTSNDTSSTDTSDDTSRPPRDLDGDGVTDDVDCDDRDPGRTPGAAERWDGEDNDCDGRPDADGTFTGNLPLDATTIYEGRTYRFRLNCPATVRRDRRTLALEAACTPDPADTDAQRTLGASLTLLAADDWTPWGPTWEDTGTLTSSSGWDTNAAVRLAWTATPLPGDPLDTLQVQAGVNAPYLTLTMTGTLRWTPGASPR
jgi:hypothetical protein